MIGRIAIMASLVAEGLVLATFAELLAASYERSDPHAVSAWAFCLVALAGYGIPRLVEGFELSPRTGYLLTAGGGLLLIYTLVRVTVVGDIALWDLAWIGDFLRDAQGTAEEGGHAITGAMLLIGAWVRSTVRSADEIEMESIPRAVAIPFAVVTVLVVLGATTDRSGEVARVGTAFYVLAVLELACSQLAMSGATFGEVRAGGTAGVLLLGSVAVAVVGLIVLALVTSVLAPLIGPPLGAAVEWTLTIILTPFAWLLTRFFEMIFQGASPFQDLTQSAVDRSQEAADPRQSERSSVGKAGIFMMRVFALAAMLGFAALLMAVFVRLRNRRTRSLEDGREAASSGDLRSDLGAMFRSLLGRRRAAPGEATTEATRLYLEVLAKAEHAGHGRGEGETAREFAPVLNQTFATPVTDDITKAFEAARYAGREPDARAIEDLRQRWQREAN